jgi:hypothetical protein
MNLKHKLASMSMTVKKHSPALFTGLGIVGLGATAYYAYKSKEKVEAVVEEIERKNDLGLEVNKGEVAMGITEAIYRPVVIGSLSIASILIAHRIQHKRILALAGALAVEQSRNIYFENKYRKQHGDEAYREFMVPTEEVEHVEELKNGKEKVTVEKVKGELDKTMGQWYDESSEYASDDHTYNLALIASVEDRMQTLLFQRGHLMLNEVREALGFERIRAGALLGWSTADSFSIDKVTTLMGNAENGESTEQIWVTWARPRYVYEEVGMGGGHHDVL